MTTLSGEFAQQGKDAMNGARLAVAQLNQSGGLAVGGRQLRVLMVTADTPATPEGALSAALELINQHHVVALVGPFLSNTAIPVANLAENAHLPMISPTATNPQVTIGKKYVFRTTFVDDFQGRIMARFAREELSARTAAVLYDVANDYNRGIAAVFKKMFEEAGGQLVAFESYVSGEKVFGSQLEQIQKGQPDVLFLPNFPDDVRLQIKEARRLGITATFLGSDVWEEQDFSNLPDFEGTFYSHHWHPHVINAQVQPFVEAYRRAYGELPTNRAALTYDTFGLLFRAIQSQDSVDGAQIVEGLSRIDRYPGVTGTISFRGNGDPLKGVIILQIKNSQVIFFKKISPE